MKIPIEYVVLGLSLVVWFLTWLTKTRVGLGVFNKLSKKTRRLIPVVFSIVAAVLYQLQSGADWQTAVKVALMTAALAVFGQEMGPKGVLRPLANRVLTDGKHRVDEAKQ